jgi:hypothetical protein
MSGVHIPPGYPHSIGYMSYHDCIGFLQKYIWEQFSLKLIYILCRKNKNEPASGKSAHKNGF